MYNWIYKHRLVVILLIPLTAGIVAVSLVYISSENLSVDETEKTEEIEQSIYNEQSKAVDKVEEVEEVTTDENSDPKSEQTQTEETIKPTHSQPETAPVTTTPQPDPEPLPIASCTFTSGAKSGQKCPHTPPPSYSASSELCKNMNTDATVACPGYKYVMSISAYAVPKYPDSGYDLNCTYLYSYNQTLIGRSVSSNHSPKDADSGDCSV